MYDILELDAIPREPGVLQNRINESRYQRKRQARRRRMLLGMLAAALLGALYCYAVDPDVFTAQLVLRAVAGVAAAVLLWSLPRAFRARRQAAPLVGLQEA